MTMRRLSLLFVLVAALAGCSSGSSNVASSTKSASPPAASPTSAEVAPTIAPTSAPAADKQSAGAAFQAAAADMRKFAPPEIKDAAGTYADVMESIAKSAQVNNTMDEATLQKALAAGMAGAASDIGKVALWVGQNCQL